MKWTSVVCKKFTRYTDPSMSTLESGRERDGWGRGGIEGRVRRRGDKQNSEGPDTLAVSSKLDFD